MREMLSSRFPVPWDIQLMHVPPDARVNEHIDPADGRLYRLNLALRLPSENGEFVCPEAFVNTRRLKFFRADEMRHRVEPISKSSRWFLSLGFRLPN